MNTGFLCLNMFGVVVTLEWGCYTCVGPRERIIFRALIFFFTQMPHTGGRGFVLESPH